METQLILSMMGGLGLILLGMKLMTDGLKMAAGSMLRKLLSGWTKTPLRGLSSGFLMTSAVQSSSAVTVAAIGFVNAGIMTLGQTVWVVYGSNIGTTTTAWIVALLGLKIKVKLLALPLVAVGTGLWLSKGMTRQAAVGEALAGFGLFFLGIEYLQGGFGSLGASIDPAAYAFPGIQGRLAFAALGFCMTFLMQSSSAAMALILTATAGGMVPLETAAAAVIGANLGTTSTAAIAVIGATANARRVAALHVIFNFITGAVAFLVLTALLGIILETRLMLEMDTNAVSVLALFHTAFNILGVLVVGPFTNYLTTFLESKFRSEQESASELKFLDDTIVSTPTIAVGALTQEVGRVAESAQRMAHAALKCRNKHQPCVELHREKSILDKLQAEIGTYSAKLRKHGLPQETSELIPDILRSLRYYVVVGETALEAETTSKQLNPLPDGSLREQKSKLLSKAGTITLHADPAEHRFSAKGITALQNDFEQDYQQMKLAFLEAGSSGQLPIDQMVLQLDFLSTLHRMIDQSVKGTTKLYGIGKHLGVYHKLLPTAPIVSS